MGDGDVSEEELEHSTTTVTTVSTPPATAPVVNGIGEAASMIAAVATLVAGSTATIMARLDENSRAAADRWKLHDDELSRNRIAITAKFEKVEKELQVEIEILEKELAAHLVVANAHFAREHDDDLVMQARVRPVQIGLQWAVNHWKDIVILVIGVLGLMAVTADVVSRYLTGG